MHCCRKEYRDLLGRVRIITLTCLSIVAVLQLSPNRTVNIRATGDFLERVHGHCNSKPPRQNALSKPPEIRSVKDLKANSSMSRLMHLWQLCCRPAISVKRWRRNFRTHQRLRQVQGTRPSLTMIRHNIESDEVISGEPSDRFIDSAREASWGINGVVKKIFIMIPCYAGWCSDITNVL